MYESKKDTLVIHLHGWCGNFYENAFVQVWGQDLSKSGISFFALNTRAHDYKCDLRIKTANGFSSQTGGGAVDDFYSAFIDICSAVDYFRSLGFKRIIVQGHSTAAQKALFYAIKQNVKDVILLSAGDIFSEIFVSNKNSKLAFDEAAKLIKENKPKEYLTQQLWGVNFTAEALINGFGENSDSDLFPIRTGKPNSKTFQFRGNVLNVLGDNDTYIKIYSNTENAKEYFAKCFPNANYKFVLLNDSHSFTNDPHKLSETILMWIEETK